jgi:galactokinase
MSGRRRFPFSPAPTAVVLVFVHPDRWYRVRQAAEHPVCEQRRVDRFAQLLHALAQQPDVATELGDLMRGSHRSYSACGLGSEGAER